MDLVTTSKLTKSKLIIFTFIFLWCLSNVYAFEVFAFHFYFLVKT